MTPAAQRMVAELLGRQLGMDAGELASALQADPITAFLTLSMVGQNQARVTEDDVELRIARIGAIFGACSVCLGDDPLCPSCRGDGKPGHRMPDPAAMLEWLERPLRRAGLCVAAIRRDGPQSKPGGEKQ